MSEHSAHDVLRVRLCTRSGCEDEAVRLTGLCSRHLRETMAPSLVEPAGPTPIEALRERRIAAPTEPAVAPARTARIQQYPRLHLAAGKPLSAREREVMELMVEGLRARDVAERLTISIETARWHIKTCYRKLRANSRDEALRLYQEPRQPDGAQCPHCGGEIP